MTVKERLHDLIEELPEQQLRVAERLMRVLRSGDYDPMLLALLTAPVDDEATTADENEGAREAREQYRRGEFVSADEAKRMLL